MPRGKDRSRVAPQALADALELLERAAADRGTLADLSAEERVRLQKAAGALARPGPEQRRRLRRALARGERDARKARDGALRKETGIQKLRSAAVFPTPPALPASFPDPDPSRHRYPASASGSESASAPELSQPRKCYVCKQPYRRLHPFYDQLCPRCGDENQARRAATADLRGRVALVTGARVKIGYQAAILLLRAGCRVVSLTRFPRDAAARYAREPDFDAWRHRLSIHGVDLRHTPTVERLCHHLEATLPRLDFQIHNACQTVRRPPGYYAHLVEGEQRPIASLPLTERALLESDEAFRAGSSGPGPGAQRPALLTQIQTEADLLPGGRAGAPGGPSLTRPPRQDRPPAHPRHTAAPPTARPAPSAAR